MSIIEALILGIVQGITEFLPISSSGHLKLTEALFGLKNLENYLFFDLICHLGTLIAIIYVFRQKILNLAPYRYVQIAIALLPLFPLLLILKPIKGIYGEPQYLGYFFLVTAFFLFLGVRFGHNLPAATLKERKWWHPLVIGTFQAIAILPGVSRSGSTISGARLIGWPMPDALQFSFLLAIPTMLGGAFIELLNSDYHNLPQMPWYIYLAGFLTSMIVGFASLKLLIIIADKNRFSVFVWYCLFIGLFSLYYFSA